MHTVSLEPVDDPDLTFMLEGARSQKIEYDIHRFQACVSQSLAKEFQLGSFGKAILHIFQKDGMQIVQSHAKNGVLSTKKRQSLGNDRQLCRSS